MSLVSPIPFPSHRIVLWKDGLPSINTTGWAAPLIRDSATIWPLLLGPLQQTLDTPESDRGPRFSFGEYIHSGVRSCVKLHAEREAHDNPEKDDHLGRMHLDGSAIGHTAAE